MIRIDLLQIRVTLGQFLIIIRTEDQPESPAFFFQKIRVQVEAYLRAGCMTEYSYWRKYTHSPKGCLDLFKTDKKENNR